MKRAETLLVAALGILLIISAGCGCGTDNKPDGKVKNLQKNGNTSPRAVIEQYLTAIREKQFKKASAYIETENVGGQKPIEPEEASQKMNGLTSYDFVVDEETKPPPDPGEGIQLRQVYERIFYPPYWSQAGGDYEFKLVKRSGRPWKIYDVQYRGVMIP